jgi:carboxymethylenebutenolidase
LTALRDAVHVEHGAVGKAAGKADDAGLAQQLEEFADGGGFDVVQAVGKLKGMVLQFVDAQPQANASRIGAVGYCMSGPFVMWAAAQFPGRFSSIASIHGANMATDQPDSPHLMAPRILCESYFACAEIDKWAPPADIQKLESALKTAGTAHRIEWYPGVEHGFVFPLRAGIYNQAAAERHWECLFSLFRRTLTA